MRDRTSWRDGLRRQLETAWSEQMPMTAPTFLDTELGLYLAWNMAPGAGVNVVPPLLSGYGATASDTVRAKITIGSARHLLATFKSPHEWQRSVHAYRQMPERWRGFNVEAAGTITIREVSTLVGRWEEYANALSRAPAHRRDGIDVARPGRHVVRVRRTSVTVDLPEMDPAPPGPSYRVASPGKRPVLQVAWADLIGTASWMDALETARGLKPGKWRHRLERCRLLTYEGGVRTFAETTDLRIAGVFNLAGMVSSGKSTLRDVLTVWAARSGMRVVVVVGDVASELRLATHLASLDVSVAPLIGQTNRSEHVSRWHRLHQEAHHDLGALELNDGSFDYLSTACALDGLRETAEPLSLDVLPCERLLPEGATTSVACPFLRHCPVHHADLRAIEASVWIATPASLVYSRPARSLNPWRMRYLELALRHADLVIVDEADAVQAQLDTAFMPSQVLAGSSDDSWLDRLESRVTQELTNRARGQLSDSTVSSWLIALRVAASAVNGIYTLLQQEPATSRWLGRGYFQEWGLALRLACEWTSTNPDQPSAARDSVMVHFEQTFEQLRGEGTGSPLASIALQALGTLDPADVREALAGWLRALAGTTLSEAQIPEEAMRLQLALLVAQLAGNLQFVYRQWHQVEAILALEAAGSGLLQGPPRDYEALVPDGPMGNVFGFQYLPPAEAHGRGGKLRSFRCTGMGRFLLLHMPDLLVADGCSGPNVLLLSGTCWAGASPTHHLGLPVAGILAPPESEVAAIATSTFDLMPLRAETGTPITVSGAGAGRNAALIKMISRLSEPNKEDGLSLLERELGRLPKLRRRLLLVVNSYEQARLVGREMGGRSAWRGRCAVLIPDYESDSANSDWMTLRRGQVAAFADTGADVIVAPLLAIERGHNILNELGEAAIGSAYFLVRPHPKPDDIEFAVHSMNRWAVDHYRQWTSGPVEKLEERSRDLRDQARRYWHYLISLPIRYGSLPDREREAITWTQLVAIVQIVGRLVRGGVAARIHFCDAAFAPASASGSGKDSPATSLLASFVEVLKPYIAGIGGSDRDRAVAGALYSSFYDGLAQLVNGDLAQV
jgi:hypothetical protein